MLLTYISNHSNCQDPFCCEISECLVYFNALYKISDTYNFQPRNHIQAVMHPFKSECSLSHIFLMCLSIQFCIFLTLLNQYKNFHWSHFLLIFKKYFYLGKSCQGLPQWATPKSTLQKNLGLSYHFRHVLKWMILIPDTVFHGL